MFCKTIDKKNYARDYNIVKKTYKNLKKVLLINNTFRTDNENFRVFMRVHINI